VQEWEQPFAALLICGDRAQTFNLGDSRIYHVTDGEIVQLTKDHTEAERLVRLGILSPEEASKSASKNMLYKFLGIPPKEGIIEADISESFFVKKEMYFFFAPTVLRTWLKMSA